MSRRLALVALLCGMAFLSWPRSASAQVSIWLQKGVSGVGAALGVSHNENQTTYGVNGGYSLRGWVDLDLTVAYLVPSDDRLPDDLYGLGVAPRVEVHPLKQGPGMPVSIGIGTGVAGFSFHSEEFEEDEIEATGWNFFADTSVYRFFKLKPNLGITPAAGVTYVHEETTISQFGDEETETDDRVSFSTAVYVAYLDPAGRIWGLAPSLNIGEIVTFGVQAGIILTL